MPLNVTITEDMIKGLSPNDLIWQKAVEIAESDRLLNPGVSADGSWLLADAKGSAKLPYSVSADFVDVNQPALRSTSPERASPDKYSLALLLSYARKPESFGTREPSDELILKREKKVAADERKKFGPAAPKRSSLAKTDKKTAAANDAVEQLDRLLFELVAAGDWYSEPHHEKMERVGKALADAGVPAASYAVRRLMLLEKQKISEDDKNLLGGELLGQLWAISDRVKSFLHNTPIEGEPANVTEYLGAELLGRSPANPVTVNGLSLLELAYERTDDDARQQRAEISSLIDLNTGKIYQSVSHRPFKGVNQIPQQPSYEAPVTVREAILHAGFINSRLEWDKTAEVIGGNVSDALATAYGLAKPLFSEVLEEFKQQLKTPLAPREAVVLLHPALIGKIGEKFTVLEDVDGSRIEAGDMRKDYSNVANLARGTAMLGKDQPAVLVRLFVRMTMNTIAAQPLALITPKVHLRLGL
ncbi:hypothetical protein [Zavarzinella formosa]|uniref:hypothetical protein n=1 Tax=Zavarzinella formosa TaxID=360055 RepID=UPI000363C651|nr:hypothetical protein [Zavarzinella formosa]